MAKRKLPVYYEDDTIARPLTAAERKWLEDLNRLLQSCPSQRLGAATTGDCNLRFFDKVLEQRPDILKIVESATDFCPGARRAKILLATVYSDFKIDSTAA